VHPEPDRLRLAGARPGRVGDDEPRHGEAGTFTERIAALEKRLLVDALQATGGNQAAAARQLGMSYHRFRYFARKHALVGEARDDGARPPQR